MADQNLEYKKRTSEAAVAEWDPITGVWNIRSSSSKLASSTRWIFMPSIDLMLDFHTLYSRFGLRLGGGILAWHGLASEDSKATAFTLKPNFNSQIYSRLRNWELNVGIQSFYLGKDAVPVFENTKSQNLVIGFGIGKRW
jgi:hypothetical protein